MSDGFWGCTKCDCYKRGQLAAMAEQSEMAVSAFKQGMQAVAWDTYAPNLAATADREAAEAARQQVQRWHER